MQLLKKQHIFYCARLINMQGGVYKPCGQKRGEGVAQMTSKLNNSYLVKVSI